MSYKNTPRDDMINNFFRKRFTNYIRYMCASKNLEHTSIKTLLYFFILMWILATIKKIITMPSLFNLY